MTTNDVAADVLKAERLVIRIALALYEEDPAGALELAREAIILLERVNRAVQTPGKVVR